MKEFLKQIGIDYKGSVSPNGIYVVDLNEDEWGRVLSILERSELVDEDEDSSNITYESSTVQFVGDEYTITVTGDFDSQTYKLTVRENGEN